MVKLLLSIPLLPLLRLHTTCYCCKYYHFLLSYTKCKGTYKQTLLFLFLKLFCMQIKHVPVDVPWVLLKLAPPLSECCKVRHLKL